MSSRWQQAWDDAEQRIRSWKQSWQPPHVHERPLRVGQLDAELLDEELVQLLQEPILKALGTLNVRSFSINAFYFIIIKYPLVNV